MSFEADNNVRSKAFKRNADLEELLSTVNQSLHLAQIALLERDASEGNTHPVVFIMGPLRSGTTLFTQWLASIGICAYPTNLLSRFYGAPVVGAMIQLLLTDERYNFRNEILDFNSSIGFTSENGKTVGALAPNEFWYFWRRFLPFGDTDWLDDDALHRIVHKDALVRELNTLTRVFDKPFALKGMILNYNIPFLEQVFNNAIFIQIRRDPVANVASVLEARKRQYGDEGTWYSFRIPEYDELRNLDPVHQAAGQVSCINRAVSRGIATVDERRRIVVDYESFCGDPRQVYDELLERLGVPTAAAAYTGPTHFKVSVPSDPRAEDSIPAALARYTD